MSATAKGISELRTALANADIRLNVTELVSRFGIATEKGKPDENARTPSPAEELEAKTEVAKAKASEKPEPKAWGTSKPKPKMKRDDE
jgi:hypothetical protein